MHVGEQSAVSPALAAAVIPVREALFPDMPVETVVRSLEAWTTIVGAISLEIFGHWRNNSDRHGHFHQQ